jgi:hypothetical protein
MWVTTIWSSWRSTVRSWTASPRRKCSNATPGEPPLRLVARSRQRGGWCMRIRTRPSQCTALCWIVHWRRLHGGGGELRRADNLAVWGAGCSKEKKQKRAAAEAASDMEATYERVPRGQEEPGEVREREREREREGERNRDRERERERGDKGGCVQNE